MVAAVVFDMGGVIVDTHGPVPKSGLRAEGPTGTLFRCGIPSTRMAAG
jgi:hypothetical protein